MAAFSIFRFALAHKLSRHRVPLAHQSRHLHPPSSSTDSSSPVSPFEYEVALGWLPQNKPLGEHGLAKLFTRVGILIEEYAQLSCCQWMWQPLSPQSRGLSQIYLHIIKYISSSCGGSQGFYKSIWIFASNVDTHCLTGFYKIPWQTRWLEMKGLTMFALVWWWEQTLTENIKDWQSLPIFLSLPFNKSPFRYPL